jgi:hypothetical protein
MLLCITYNIVILRVIETSSYIPQKVAACLDFCPRRMLLLYTTNRILLFEACENKEMISFYVGSITEHQSVHIILHRH